MELLDYPEIAYCWHLYPCELSGGEQQRVAIALALANTSKVLRADESTAALATERGKVVMGLLRRLSGDRKSVV